MARGAYVLGDAPGGNPDVILIASGSEVILAVHAHEKLLAEGIRSRVVSMPSWDMFEIQTQEYRDSVLPPKVKARVAVEQGSIARMRNATWCTSGPLPSWHEDLQGLGTALKELQTKFGFEPEKVVAAAKAQLAAR